MNKINIMIFGDSITYGCWDTEENGWVNRLRFSLEKGNDCNQYTIYNLGVPGDITSKLKNRFDFECRARFKENEINIIIFAIGINDTQNITNEYRVSVEEFRNNISTLIENAKKYTDNIIFIGLTPVDEKKVVPLSSNNDKCYLNKKIVEFDIEIENICFSNNIDYLKVYNLLTTKDLSDGLHPNNVGHQKLFNEISTKIVQYF